MSIVAGSLANCGRAVACGLVYRCTQHVGCGQEMIPPLWKISDLRLPRGRLGTPQPLCDRERSLGLKRSSNHAKQCSPPLQVKPRPQTYVPQLSPPSTKSNQISNRKTREKRSVSVVHNCAEKNSERFIHENRRQLNGSELLRSRRGFWLENSSFHRRAGCTSGLPAGDQSQEATSSPLQSGNLSIFFFNQQPVRT